MEVVLWRIVKIPGGHFEAPQIMLPLIPMNEPLGIYIHIPFCASRCFYCHFVIDLSRGEIQRRYADALLTEIEQWGNRFSKTGDPPVNSIYIGGGTPSWVDPRSIERILRTLQESFLIAKDAEVTIEVNPDSLDDKKIATYFEAGINRVSVGVQSFHDDELKRLGRTHTAHQARQALLSLREGGFKNISIDLIGALPGQSLGRWKENFAAIQELHPEHLSLYLFDVDEDSALGRRVLAQNFKSRFTAHSADTAAPPGPSDLPGEEEVVEIYQQAISELTRLGYEQYEISNFAKRSAGTRAPLQTYRSRHNFKYWNLQPYLGFGCAAHSFLLPHRWHNENSTEGYIHSIASRQDPRREIEEMTADRLAEDTFILGLRQIEGIRYDRLSIHLNRNARSLFRNIIEPLMEEGWLIERDGTLRLAPHAVLISNEIFARFVNAE